MNGLRVATWNTKWRTPTSRRGSAIRERLEAFEPDLLCLTECHADFLKNWKGHSAENGLDWGHGPQGDRREALIWSRWPWRDIDARGSLDLPQGRFVRAVTDTPLGAVTLVGVVIPYHFANVSDGRQPRKLWEEHCLYLDALQPILREIEGPLIVLGDFNQRIPSTWVPRRPREKLADVFRDLQIVTAGNLEFNGKRPIDHVACSDGFTATSVGTLSNQSETGRELSDHFGVTCSLRWR